VPKNKALKVPVELIGRIKETGTDLPPGEVLEAAYNEYIRLKELADVLSGDKSTDHVSDIIITHIKEESCKYKEFDASLTELSTMVAGLSMFFTKYGGKK